MHIEDNAEVGSRPQRVIQIAALAIAGTLAFVALNSTANTTGGLYGNIGATTLEEKIAPPEGVTLPIVWGDIGKKMVAAGVIDIDTFESLYAQRGGLDQSSKQLLYGGSKANLKITPRNAGALLNMLWAFGLSNKNKILEEGPMTDERYGGAGRFASTGGWTLARGNAMDHYDAYTFVILTKEQQEMVERVSKNIYRPCCDNPTYFPDCNHGMAMLGLLELMASQGVSEEEIYDAAFVVNSYWFPDVYHTIARYLTERGFLAQVSEKDLLGKEYSSASGYQRILTEVTPSTTQSGGGCSA